MPPNNESSENKPAPSSDRLRFLADRMAMLMVELVRRDLDYGRFCHEEYFTDEISDKLRESKEYDTCIDFVRRMLRKHDAAQKE